MLTRRRTSVVPKLACALLLASRSALGADPEPVKQRYWVDFEAGKVELDGDLSRLALEKDVVIKVDRYRLTSQKLTLRRTSRGVVVDGEGRVAFCRCENPPITFGFRQAIVAPPTDLFVREPTVRLGGVPVLWLPVLWLRAPDRLGLLPPTVAWRGADGLLAGTGVHVPVGGRRGPTLETIDLYASGYLKGGVELQTRLATEHSSTAVRWDHLRADLLALDTHGAAQAEPDATAAWRIDAIRGVRGRYGTLELEPAARRYDRGRASVQSAWRGVVGGLGVSATMDRGSALDDLGTLGPEAHLGFGTAVGSGSALDVSIAATSLRQVGSTTTSLALGRGRFDLGTSLGPLWLGATLDQRGALWSEPEAQRVDGSAGARVTAALPFWRGFGSDADPLVHRVEPFVSAGARASGSRGAALAPAPAPRSSRTLLALGGLQSGIGRQGSRSAFVADARAGGIGSNQLSPIVGGALSGDAEIYSIRADGALVPERGRAYYSALRARLGRADALHVGGRLEGQGDLAPTDARWLGADAWDVPSFAWLDSPGWSAGSELGIPWTTELATLLSADADLGRERWLAVHGALGYRHRCGCLAAVAAVGQRLGRDGIDAEIRLDLMP